MNRYADHNIDLNIKKNGLACCDVYIDSRFKFFFYIINDHLSPFISLLSNTNRRMRYKFEAFWIVDAGPT